MAKALLVTFLPIFIACSSSPQNGCNERASNSQDGHVDAELQTCHRLFGFKAVVRPVSPETFQCQIWLEDKGQKLTTAFGKWRMEFAELRQSQVSDKQLEESKRRWKAKAAELTSGLCPKNLKPNLIPSDFKIACGSAELSKNLVYLFPPSLEKNGLN